jgi:hypothetical protein
MDNMLGKFVELVNWFDDLTNGVYGNVLGPVKDLVPKLSDPEDRLEFRREFAKFLRKEPCWIDRQVTQVAESKPIIYTRCISVEETLELDETDGEETIAKAEETFPGWIDPDFKGYGCDVKSEPTMKMQVSVYEMIKDGTFAQIWNGMSDDLNSLCLTQPQIIQFVQKHRKWLRTEGYGTLFLFKVGNEFFVALVRFDGGGQLRVRVGRFSFDFVWSAAIRHRIVVPQLEPLAPSVP